MDYLNNVVANNAPIQNAVRLVQQLPITQHLLNIYSRSSKNERYFIGAATFITLYNLSAYIKEKRQKLHLPPTVPFALPFLGHNLYLMVIPGKFIDWCNAKYGEVYRLKLLGKYVTVASGKSAEEAMKAEQSDLSLEHGIVRDLLHLDYVLEPEIMDIGIKVNPIIAKSTLPNQKMPYYIPGIQFGLENAVNELLKHGEPTIINQPSTFFQNFVAYMSVPSLVGEEFSTNPDVIKSFAEFTGDVIKNISVFLAIPKFLHKLVLPYLQSAKKHTKVMEDNIAPVIELRREKMKLASEAGQDHGLKASFLQGLIEYTYVDENGNTKQYNAVELSHAILLVAFASVHTTSMNLSFSIYWLLARPDLMEKLMEEIDRVVPGDTPVDSAKLAEMKFLNNFMREVLRQGADRLANGKKAMKDFTFSNGYQVAKGDTVESTVRGLNFGDNVTRSAVDEMDPNMSHDKTSTTPARDFASFGMGKHLCPGRFFAVQEIQMSLVHLLKNYTIQTVSGKRPEPIKRIAGTVSTNCEDPLIFTPRK